MRERVGAVLDQSTVELLEIVEVPPPGAKLCRRCDLAEHTGGQHASFGHSGLVTDVWDVDEEHDEVCTNEERGYCPRDCAEEEDEECEHECRYCDARMRDL